MPLHSLLVATDFSASARAAAMRAGLLARELGVRLTVLLHVAAPQESAAAAREALKRLSADVRARTGARFAPRLLRGGVADTLARAARRADLVVIGAHGQHPVRDLALGSTAERLLRRIQRPVLVVKRRAAHAYRQVLLPVDFSRDARAAFALARELAPRAELNLLHAFEVPHEGKLRFAGVAEERILMYRRRAREQARAELDALLRHPGAAAGRVTRHLVHGYAPAAIARAEREIEADLVAVGKHGASALEDLLLGSVTLHTLASSACDVLVVPAGAVRGRH